MATNTLRLLKELADIQKNPDQAIYVSYNEDDITNVRALIMGPPDTPYEYGFFEFNMQFPRDYPTSPPKVNAITTNGGRTRFNPNIYAGGKVCLSILGTWRGEAGEQWSSAQGIESVLLSIQSLMSANPFENEPGYEAGGQKEKSYKAEQEQYCQKIQHETFRISILQRLEGYMRINSSTGRVNPLEDISHLSPAEREAEEHTRAHLEPFTDLCKRLFRYYYPTYMRTISRERGKVQDGQQFTIMPFEYGGNQMGGKFSYHELERRMNAVKAVIDAEAETWVKQGAEATKNDEGISASLQLQFDQTYQHFLGKFEGTVMLELIENNPFCWRMIYIGRPMTNLDGGLFRIKMVLSQRFPEEQPRVMFETPIYHVNITSDGVPYYRPRRTDDIKSHIEALIDVLESEQLSPDPRTWMNLDAAQLYFGKPEDQREYRKAFRRAVQRSSEY
ncbi:ubiquitin-conjugating enzyme/RWD-like protein [Lipomyces tetrasporus]